MKQILLILISTCLITIHCSSNSGENNQNVSTNSIITTNSSLQTETKQAFSNYDNSIFLFVNDTLKQTLKIKIKSENQIEFEFISENTKQNKTYKLDGIASLIEQVDAESDVDEDGNGYFVDEYSYNKDCSVLFRMDADEFNRATMKTHDCNLKLSGLTPINSIGIMRRIK